MIVTLIGSARFEPWFKIWNEVLSLAGHCVFSLAVYPSDKREGFSDPLAGKIWYTEAQKMRLDAVHKAKIRHSEAVVLLNVFGYIGDSTLSEIAFATSLAIPIHPLESWGRGCGIGHAHFDSVQEAAKRHGVYGIMSPIDTHTPHMEEQANFSHLLGPAGPERSALIRLIRECDQKHGGSHEGVSRSLLK